MLNETGIETNLEFLLRKAQLIDRENIELLIAASARGLSRADYTEEQIEAAIKAVFGVDTDLIHDQTYFVVEHTDDQENKILIGCGGWSKRKTLFGGDRFAARESAFLDPTVDPAKIRAFFVHPLWARKGIGRALLLACEKEAIAHGFKSLELMATLPGARMYRVLGFAGEQTITHQINDNVTIEFLPMKKNLIVTML